MLNVKISKKKLQSMRTRESILESASRCFGANGYLGCSLETIAQATDITKGAIYSHFDSKSELFVAIINFAYNRALQRTKELKEQLSFVDAIIQVLYECFRDPAFPIDHRLWVEIIAMAGRDEKVKAVFLRCQAEVQEIIEKWLFEGIRAGEINSTLDIKSVSDMIFIIGNGLILHLCDTAFNFENAFKIFENTMRTLLQPKS